MTFVKTLLPNQFTFGGATDTNFGEDTINSVQVARQGWTSGPLHVSWSQGGTPLLLGAEAPSWLTYAVASSSTIPCGPWKAHMPLSA